MYVFLPPFTISFMQKLALRTHQTAQGDGVSLPCGSAWARQVPPAPESQVGKGNTSDSHLLGCGQSLS